jgi:LysR family glycine cleavage system transcriptional activator
MSKYLPSVTALLAFEAAARHLSFTRAAMELNLTQTAISHRIKDLETILDIRLFRREQNRIRLTEQGRDYLDLIKPALSQIAAATDRISRQGDDTKLRIACLSAFAIKCLLPVLDSFRRRHREIELRITPVVSPENPIRHDFDVAICHGAGDWRGFEAEKLGVQELFPVCSPKLLAEGPPLRTPEDLRHHTIIRTFSPVITDDWPAWLEHAGVAISKFDDEICCDGSFLSIEAAVNGLGVFMGRSEMVRDDLLSRRLVEPFDIRLESTSSYYVVTPIGKSMVPKVRVFREWVLDQFARTEWTALQAGD